MYTLVYGLIPFLIMYEYTESGIDTLGIDFSDLELTYILAVLIFSVAGYFLIGLGYRVKVRSHSIKQSNNVTFGRRLFPVLIITTLIAFVSLYLWTRSYGGPLEMMKYAQFIRSGYVIKENKFAFFKRFANISTMGAYIAFGLIINPGIEKQHRFLNYVMLSINVYVKIMYSLIDDGRMTTAIFIVGFPAVYIYHKYLRNKVNLRKALLILGVLLVSGYVLIIFSNPIMNYVRYGEFNMTFAEFDLLSSLRRELGYTFASSQTAMKLRFEGYDYTFLRDVASGLFSYLPTGLTPVYARTHLTYINSVNLYGPDVQYGSPPDFLSVSLYDLGILGVIIYPILFGLVIKQLDKFFKRYKVSSIWGTILYICLAFRISRVIANASFYNVALSIFHIVFTYCLYWVVNHFSTKNI
jgi:hypothetical protein